eukprot:403361825
MIDSEKYWRRKYDDDNQGSSLIRSFSKADIMPNAPKTYGIKNEKYLSPTYKSNAVLYGDNFSESSNQKIAQKHQSVSKAIFKTLQANTHQLVEKNMKKTQNPEYEPQSLRNKGNLNYKNFSQVQIGYNTNVEESYRQQFSEKKSKTIFGMEKLKSQVPVQKTMQKSNSVDGRDELFFKGKKKYDQNQLQSQGMNQTINHNDTYKREFYASSFKSTESNLKKSLISQKKMYHDQVLRDKSNDQGGLPKVSFISNTSEKKNLGGSFYKSSLLQHSTSQKSIWQPRQSVVSDRYIHAPYDEPETSKTAYFITSPNKATKQSIKYNCDKSNEKFNRIKESTLDYQVPDWGFFSPQQDPFKKAFEKKQAKREMSADKINANLQRLLSEELQVSERKNALTTSLGDNLIQVMTGDTLRLRHDKRNSQIQERNKDIMKNLLGSPEANHSKQQKDALQHDQFAQSGVYLMIDKNQSQRDRFYRTETLKANEAIQQQKLECRQRNLQDKTQELVEERIVVQNYIEKEDKRNQDRQQFIEQNRQDMNIFKENKKAEKIKDHKQHQTNLEIERETLISKVNSGLKQKQQYEQQKRQTLQQSNDQNKYQKQIFKNLTASLKLNKLSFGTPQQQKNEIRSSPTKSIVQKSLNEMSLKALDKSLAKTQNQFLNPQNSVYGGPCLSAASTMSHCSNQQLTKANVSKQEFELRKKQVQMRKKNTTTRPLLGLPTAKFAN